MTERAAGSKTPPESEDAEGELDTGRYELEPSRVRRDLKIRAHSLYGRRLGVASALAQPQTKSGCSGCYSTQTEQLDHGFAPSRRNRFGIHGWCTFDFKTSLRLTL